MTILDTIYELLKMKQYTTVPEIASYAELKKIDVLKIINRNKELLTIDKNGKISAIQAKTVLKHKLAADGMYFWITKGNYGSWDNLNFCKHEKLREEMTIEDWEGGFGDCYKVKRIPDTPENRAKLEAEKCVLEGSIVLDNRLWKE